MKALTKDEFLVIASEPTLSPDEAEATWKAKPQEVDTIPADESFLDTLRVLCHVSFLQQAGAITAHEAALIMMDYVIQKEIKQNAH